ncbi:B12-binding domain-containing radical SAM protein, partial [Candidatus Woesearchaeota archaeon]|nr:B12-binding domain-containing radical SAM protein [Candidatus Woesearchaeota archaeon]
QEITVIVGGIYPTLLPRMIMSDDNIDYAIMGEGEFRFPRLLKYLENKNFSIEDIDGLAYKKDKEVIVQKVLNYIQDLDALPFPDYSDLDFYAYANKGNKYSYFIYPQNFPYAFTITSRGCPFNCIFCSSKAINGPKIRFRSAENVLKEVEWLLEKYKIKEIIFLDDNIYLNRTRMKKILLGLIELRKKYFFKWKSPNVAVYALDDEILELAKESGCYQIAIAIESGCEEVLELMKKPYRKLDTVWKAVNKARSLGIIVTAMFVLGIPGEKWEQIRKTIHFAEELALDYVSFSIATPLPKTELYEIAKRDNLLTKNFGFTNLDFKGYGKALITTNEFTPQELQILRAFEWDRINFKDKNKWPIIAEMNGITLEELQQWRVKTRRSTGLES